MLRRMKQREVEEQRNRLCMSKVSCLLSPDPVQSCFNFQNKKMFSKNINQKPLRLPLTLRHMPEDWPVPAYCKVRQLMRM